MNAGRLGCVALAAYCLVFCMAAGPPEIRRVHAPARKATSFFPAGSELRVLSVDEFEKLVKDAEEGGRATVGAMAPQLLKAEHRARLDGDLLTGETLLSFDAPSKTSGIVEVQPWTPALATEADGKSRIVHADDGRFFLRLDDTTSNPVRIAWTLRARTGSEGSVFSLGLPRVEISSLRLDLPSAVVPEGSAGIRQGPVPSDRPGRQVWRFDGAPGLIELRLQKTSTAGVLANRSRNWIGGRTTVLLDESVATWKGEWTVDLGVGSSRTVFLDLDPGLQLLDVQGPALLSFRTEPVGDRSRLTMQLSEDIAASSPITLQAVAPLPDEGPWSVPAIQPVEAVWTGGRTSIRIGESRALEGCEVRDGVRVGATAEEEKERQPEEIWLDFETTGPRSVAELTLRHPREKLIANVLSRLNVGREEMELDSRVTWTAARGRLLVASLDLPGGWTVERAASLTKDVVISWLVEPLSGGGSRLVVRPSEAIATGKELSLQVTATGKPPALGGWLDLPRPRTPGAVAEDERAMLFTDAATNVRSVDARGMVWLDPESLDPNEPGVLAWRWTKEDARGRVSFDPRAIPTSATVRERVTIDPHRLRISARVKLKLADGVLRHLRFVDDAPHDAVLEWRLEDDPQGPPLPIRRLESAGDASGPAVWEVELPYPKRGTVELTAKCEYAWNGHGAIPRIHFEPEYPTSGRIQVDVERTMRTSLEAEGVRVLESAPVDGEAADPAAPVTDVRHRPGHWLSYAGGGGRIELTTENLSPVPCDGVIREAMLRSRFLSSGSTLHRMDLHIVLTGARELGFTLPAGLTVQQVQVDGRPSTPFAEGKQLKIPLTASSSTRPGCVVHLEFTQAARALPHGSLRPILPEFNLPVLSLVWQLDEDREGDVTSPDLLVPMALNSVRATVPEVLGPSWSSIAKRPEKSAGKDSRTELRKAVRAIAETDLTFGEFFTRLDAGKQALVIDRIALAERGITPATLLPVTTARLPASEDPFQEFGLISVEADGAWIITTSKDQPEGELRPASKAVTDAIQAHGCDPSDRYRTVARWCVALDNLADNAAESGTGQGQSPMSWYATVGLDVAKARVLLDPSAIPHGLAWGVCLTLFGLGIGTERWNIRVRLVLLTLVVLGVSLGIPRSGILWNDLSTGTLWGALACLGLWSTRRSPKTSTATTGQAVRTTSDPNRNVNAAVGLMLVAGFVSWWIGTQPVRAAEEKPAPVVAVFAEEPSRKPVETDVVLLLSDDARLRALADGSKPRTVAPDSILSSSVEHRVRVRGVGIAEVESHYRLTPDPKESKGWSFPLGSARDVRAVLNGRDVPILIQPGGQIGLVLVPPGEIASLILSRSVPIEAREDSESLTLAVIPSPASVVVLENKSSENIPTFPSARGESKVIDGRTTRVDLGPTSRLEILWSKVAPGERPRPRGSADALLLWDAEPAGDRVRVRLTLNNLRDPSQLRIGLDPGWVVLSTSIPGLIDTGLRGTRERPEWIARTDPPLPDGATIRFELWRPREFIVSRSENETARPLPRVEPLDVAAFIGRLGFRRPDGWRGRLRASAGSDPMTDEEFVNAWGTLPDNRATLAGAIRYALTPKFTVDVTPIPVRVLLTPEVRLQLQPGRVLVSADFKAEARGGLAREVEFTPPKGMVVERVEAPGLSDWSQPAPDRLLLRFDRDPKEQFTIRVGGFLPLAGDPEGASSLTHELPVPLFRLPGSERLAGTLAVDGPPSTQIELRATRASAEEAGGDVIGRAKGTLAVDLDPNSPEEVLRWTDEASRVRVLVRAVLAMNSTSADWLANLRYRSSDGPVDRIAFRVPASWSRSAKVSIPGVEFRGEQKVDGDSTLWTLSLGRPVWGDVTVQVSASQPLPSDGMMAFPDLLPLGRGRVDTYLALANSTAHPLFAEGSSSVQEIDPSRVGVVLGLPDDLKLLKAFRVLKDGWSLRARLGVPAGAHELQRNPARVGSADLSCVLDGAGMLLGEARFVLESDASAFLPLVLPSTAEAVAALVDRVPVRPLVGKGGMILIPLGEGRPRLVSVVWKDRVAGGSTAEIELPSLRQENVPTLVRLHLPPGQTSTPSDARFQRIKPADREVRLLEWMNREITVALLPSINRGAARDQADLLAALVDFEMQARVARRTVAHVSLDPTARQRGVATIAAAQAALGNTLNLAGLDPFLQSARARVGLAATDPLPEIPRLVDRASVLGIPRIGTPWDFAGEGPPGSSRPKLRIVRNQGTANAMTFDPRSSRIIGGLVAFLCLGLIVPSLVNGSSRLLRLVGTLSILGLSTPLGPSATLTVLAVLGFGRLARMRA